MASSILLSVFAAFFLSATTANAGGQRGRGQQGVIRLREENSATEEKSPAEAFQANSIHDPVLKLNQNIFQGNVANAGGRVGNWVVLYCPYWWEPCQQISPHFEKFAGSYQERLNKDLMSSHVRFARVDCATEKPLCNLNGVEDYPTVQHFKDGQLEKTWTGRKQVDPEGLSKFLKTQLESPPAAAESESVKQFSLAEYLVPGDRAFDMLLVAVLAVSFWAMSRNADLWHRRSDLEKEHPFIPEEVPTPPTPVGLRRRHEHQEHAPQQQTGIGSLMPQEWLAQPAPATSLAMEL